MNNDLISREALKREFERPFWENWEWEFICKTINNAPTVGAIVNTIEVRPQGEWEEGNHGDYERPDIYFQCSVCKEETDDETPYCPYCGADMRGGAE